VANFLALNPSEAATWALCRPRPRRPAPPLQRPSKAPSAAGATSRNTACSPSSTTSTRTPGCFRLVR